jgi:hypothetical protein
MDSGAIGHVCFNKPWFLSFHKINLVYVKFPNGNSVIADLAGSIRISDLFILHFSLFLSLMTIQSLLIIFLRKFDF